MIPTYTMDEDGNLVETVEGSENAYYSTLKAKEVDFTANERQKKKTGFDIKAKDEDFYEFIKKTVKEHFPDVKLRREGDVLIFDEKHLGFRNCDILKYSEKYFGYRTDFLYTSQQAYAAQGIRVLSFFSDEWADHREICKSIVRAALGIFKERYYARKCRVEYLTREQSIEFFNANHLQGASAARYTVGLLDGDKIVAALSISPPRFSQKSDFEVIRYACKLNTQAVGAFMKCLKFFTKDHTGIIATYSDARIFSSDTYRHNFVEVSDDSTLDYGYYYSNGRERFNRFKFQKFKLVKAYPEFEKITEHDIALVLGYYRIFDAGQRKFIYTWNNNEENNKAST